MKTLKKVLMISGIIFFIVATIGIVISVNINTNFFKSTITLACEPDDTDFDFSLIISKRNNTVQWQGSDTGRERVLKYMSDSSIQMEWLIDDDDEKVEKEVVFTLNRLTGNFSLDVEDRDSDLYGRCYEAKQKF
jgi:hypothetical protein